LHCLIKNDDIMTSKRDCFNLAQLQKGRQKEKRDIIQDRPIMGVECEESKRVS
jgi:hypothetical protein